MVNRGSDFFSYDNNSLPRYHRDVPKMVKYDQFILNNDASGLEMLPKLGFSLDRLVIKPLAVYEDLPKDEVKEQINLRPKKKAGIYGIFNLNTGDFTQAVLSNSFTAGFTDI